MRYLKATSIDRHCQRGSRNCALRAAGLVATTRRIFLLRDSGLQDAQGNLRSFEGAADDRDGVSSFALAWTTVDITRPILKTIVAFGAIFLLFSGSGVAALYNIFFSPFPEPPPFW